MELSLQRCILVDAPSQFDHVLERGGMGRGCRVVT